VELTHASNVTPLEPRRLSQGRASANDPRRQVQVDPVAVARDLAELVTREHKLAADERHRRERAEAAASELVVIVAHEHRRASEEEERRRGAEATASDLAVLVAHEHAALEEEREARRRAEAAASRLTELLAAERGGDEQIVAKRARFARRG
jgi:hypothetical protein